MKWGKQVWYAIGPVLTALGVGAYWLLGHCRHKNVSRVFDFKSPVNSRPTGHYVVCLDCGAQWNYNMTTMKKGAKRVRNNSNHTTG